MVCDSPRKIRICQCPKGKRPSDKNILGSTLFEHEMKKPMKDLCFLPSSSFLPLFTHLHFPGWITKGRDGFA